MNPKDDLKEYARDMAKTLKATGKTSIPMSAVFKLHDESKYGPYKGLTKKGGIKMSISELFKKHGSDTGLCCSGKGGAMKLVMDTSSGTSDVSVPTVQVTRPQVTPPVLAHEHSHITHVTLSRGQSATLTVSATVRTDEAGTDASDVCGELGDEDADRISGLQDQFHQMRRACQLLVDREIPLPPDLKALVTEDVDTIAMLHQSEAGPSHSVARFCDKSTLTVDACTTLEKLKKKGVDVNKPVSDILNDIKRSGLDLRDLVTNIDWTRLVFEVMKGMAYKTGNALYTVTTPELRDRFLLELSDLDHLDLSDGIRDIARRYNVTTTALGIAIFGGKSKLGDSEDRVAQCVKGMNDILEGSLIRGSKSHGVTNQTGWQGECEMMKALREAGVMRDEYLTEQDQKVLQTGKGTPDILFKKLTAINGVEVKWIDAKNMLLIPGVSSGETVNNYDMKMERYVTEHGPGAIVWTKTKSNKNRTQKHAVGFPENLRDRHENVAHFTLIPSGTNGYRSA